MLLEEVRWSPSFVKEDFHLLQKIARHLELSDRVRNLCFNFPLSSLPCCMTPSTSQCWCLACLYACWLFICVPVFSSQSTGISLPGPGSDIQDLDHPVLSHKREHGVALVELKIRKSNLILILHNYFCGMMLQLMPHADSAQTLLHLKVLSAIWSIDKNINDSGWLFLFRQCIS